MKKFAFALVAGLGAVLLNVNGVNADQPTTTPTPGTTATTTGTVIVTDATTTPTRRMGLFGRLRNRSTRNAVPVITTSGSTITTPTTTPATPGTIPTPMPRTGGTSGTTPLTTVTPTAGTVVPASYVVTEPTTARRGLFGRMRNRGTTPTMATMPTTAPMPMPTTGTKTTPATDVVPASGTTPATTANGSPIMTADYVVPVQTRRLGLIGRLRNR